MLDARIAFLRAKESGLEDSDGNVRWERRFVQALRSASGCTVTAVGARSLASAETFAKANAIEHAFGSYEELCNCDEVDVIYIGTVHPAHKKQAIMAMRAGKHVL